MIAIPAACSRSPPASDFLSHSCASVPVCAMTSDPVGKENSMSSSSEEEDEPVRPVRKKGRTADQVPDSSGDNEPVSPVPRTLNSMVENYRILTNEMISLDIRPDNTVHNARRATSLINQADGLADMAYGTNGHAAVTYDGEFMNATGQVVHRIAETMEVDSRIFCLKEFASCLKKVITGTRNGPVTKTGLSEFNRTLCRRMHRSAAPVFKYLRGAHDFSPMSATPVPQPERPAPKKRIRFTASPTRTRAAVIRTAESLQNVDRDQTVIEVENLHTQIENMFVDNGRRPVPYLTIVVDDSDFGKTVENVFHFSFLVKEGYDKIIIHKGITSVEPVDEQVRVRSTAQANQVLFSFSQRDWMQWCDKIKTTAYRIPG